MTVTGQRDDRIAQVAARKRHRGRIAQVAARKRHRGRIAQVAARKRHRGRIARPQIAGDRYRLERDQLADHA
jgi:hypothetical protein